MSSSLQEELPDVGDSHTPLAARMRPRTLDEFAGQEHLVGHGRAVRRSVENDQLTSMILWGPPGCGKTTLAEVIASTTRSRFVSMSAVSSGVADLRREVEAARKLLSLNGRRTVLFIDEIHRFNKAQQDAVLPHVERGTVTLIGATTENPSFEVISALLSRCRVFRLEKLSDAQVESLVRRALADKERGLGQLAVEVDDETLSRLVRLSDGDARVALTALEMAVLGTLPGPHGSRSVTIQTIEDVMQRPSLLYDKAGDMHYHLISAFIKSVRGSDPDAAIYWLVRMVEAGEDPLFVTRRMVILAAEDIGLADPQALVLATACHQAVHSIGMPEGHLPMSETALYLSLAPKSNSALTAYGNALQDVADSLNAPVPLHLRNAVTALNRAEGYGKGYRYAHDFDRHYVDQRHLPDELAGRRYYRAGDQGQEPALSERLEELREQNR